MIAALLFYSVEVCLVIAGVQLLGAKRHDILGGTFDNDSDDILVWKLVGDGHAFTIRIERNSGHNFVVPFSVNQMILDRYGIIVFC